MPNDSKILTDQSDESDKARSWTNNGKKTGHVKIKDWNQTGFESVEVTNLNDNFKTLKLFTMNKKLVVSK